MMKGFSLYYQKYKNNTNNIMNESLLAAREHLKLNLSECQTYIPIYSKFFSLNDTNYNSIVLNQTYTANNFLFDNYDTSDDGRIINAHVGSENGKVEKKSMFLKYSPLLDPIKYLSGKYDITDDKLKKLPQLQGQGAACHSKSLDPNNSAYVDGFFSYLSSQLLHSHKFMNGLDFYGSFLAIQREFSYNIIDEQDYFLNCPFFENNKDVLFHVDGELHYYDDSDSYSDYSIDSKCSIKPIPGKHMNHKNNLNIDVSNTNNVSFDCDPFEIDGCYSPSDVSIPSNDNNNNVNVNVIDNIDNIQIDKTIKLDNKNDNNDDSSCSSRTSITDDDYDCSSGSESESGSGSGTESGSGSGSGSGYDDVLNCFIFNFPVAVIMLEKCSNTLDSLMDKNSLSDIQWEAALMQIVMTLLTYQCAFSFTHNDLHTNNIMYVETEREFLYYCVNKTHYKVPTHGRIFKIIDFGRAIYKYNSILMCSDSFHPQGDAATQYNCDPYFDETKPRLEPNFSFDLCRLGCSLFDYFVDDIKYVDKECKHSRLVSCIVGWITDDGGKNILYKKNGDDRYPEFKLYKMIARNVHHKTPIEQLENPIFAQYKVSHASIKKRLDQVFNIDKLPKYENMNIT